MEIICQQFEGKQMRVIERDGQPWFVLADVCDALELTSPHKVAARLDEDERTQIPVIDAMGRAQDTTVINESGLYAVILRSDKAQARSFRKWITNEVLPALRTKGSYTVPISNQDCTAPALISAAQIGLSTGQTRNAAGKYVNSFGVHPVAYYHEDLRKQIVHLFNLAEVERVYAERQYPLRAPLVPHGGTVIQGQPPKAIKAAPAPNVKLPDRHFADAYRIGGDLGVKLLQQFLSEELEPRMKSALGLA